MDTNTQKKILNQARQSSSLYTMNLKAFNVVKNQKETLWNPQSDRNLPAIVKRHVPTRGSSVKSSITRARPGSLSAKGSGVDIKHGSYARYLEKLKGKTLSSKNTPVSNPPKYGNKTRSQTLIFNSECGCN